MLTYTDSDIDQIVIEEFPYPIARAYRLALEESDKNRKTDLCLQTFYYTLRSISFIVLVEYLKTPPEKINDADLNSKVQKEFKKTRTQQWIELLEYSLKAYQNHQDQLFPAELYDLYWDHDGNPTKDHQDFWDSLRKLAFYENSILGDDQGQHIDKAQVAEELIKILRVVMRHIIFVQSYELLKIREITPKQLSFAIYRGQAPSIRHVYIDEKWLASEVVQNLNPDCFYIWDGGSTLHELHPLIVSEDMLDRISQSPEVDTGMFSEYLDAQTIEGDEIIYRMLRNDNSRRGRGELVKLFLHLYKTELDKKIWASRPQKPLNLENIREICLIHSNDQMKNLIDINNETRKYLEDAYIEREEMNIVLSHFMMAEEPVLIVSGNVGVGKTSLLVHFYQQYLSHQAGFVTLWLDGALFLPEQSFAENLINIWDPYLFFDKNPSTPEEATALLHDIVSKYLRSEVFVIILDGVNENDEPSKVFEQINNFILTFPSINRVKIIATSRPQVWQYARNKHLLGRYRSVKYFHRLPPELGKSTLKIENDAFELTRYQKHEVEQAFEAYTSVFLIQNPHWEKLSESLRRALQEPLLMRLTCEAFRGRTIPSELQADDIIKSLIDRLVDDPTTKLEQKDFDFLEKWIVPQFIPQNAVPVAKLLRRQLQHIQVTPTRSLDDLIVDPTKDIEGEPVNARTQRLMDTGWLIQTGSQSSYSLRFRFEYFYDYFVGKYLFEQYSDSANKMEFFRDKVRFLPQAPFLWGSMRNLLVDLLKEKHYDFIEELGHTNDPFQYELLVSVLSEYYPQHKDHLHPILLRWLEDA